MATAGRLHERLERDVRSIGKRRPVSELEGGVELRPENQDGAAQSEEQQDPAREDADHEMEAERDRAYSHGRRNATTAGA
jgi:hypothetical protein